MWAIRIVHESTLYADQCGNSFVTLTYRNKDECTPEQLRNGHYIPDDWSLNKKHFKNFIRRLRKNFPQKIRYFHCGEYGDITERPHYHACLFNCFFDDQRVWSTNEGVTVYSSVTLDKLWPYGFATVGELNYETAAYTARYILKKVNGYNAPDHYMRCDEYGVAYWLQPEYVTMSLKPGIGRGWYEQYKTDMFPADHSPVPGKGVVTKVPRYYQTILEKEDPDTFELVKKLRKEFITNHRADFTPDRLMDKYKVKRASQQLTKREAI